ncbi:helix-turn-helix domain-containing protein [Hymenobacter siberiensis]|uniref:helix-turn-helix domain-containing protein n=1 Tax=Hymenobacter siberiensis TaxID=2848396 RepID=UPI001C1E5158|nr:helix-turn-helix domain-containing protein [Hymenobacter siberiensis]
MKAAGWLSTQERAFALLALGKIARQNARSTTTASLFIDGKPAGNFDGKDLTLRNVANRNVSIRTAGRGSLYYYWETEGISASGQVHEEDSYLKVRRQFLNRDGVPLGAPVFRQNDLVVVKITLEAAESAGQVKNFAINDLLPAGLEIENPRIGPLRELSWAKDAATPDYLDVRDDRINLFTTAILVAKLKERKKGSHYLVGLTLPDSERVLLQQAQRACRGQAGYVPVTVLLMLDQGHAAARVAQALGVDVSSVYRYAQTYQLHGLAGYLRAEQPGYWGLLTSAQLAGLCRELGQQLYTDCRAIADWLAATYGVRYSVSGLTDVLHRLGPNALSHFPIN